MTVKMMNESTQLNVLISGGFTGAYEQLLPEFQRMSGIEVTTGSGASQGSCPQTIAAQLGRGVAADVVILSREGLSELIAAKMIAAGTPPTRRRLDAASGSFGRTQAAKSCKIVPQPSKSALLGAGCCCCIAVIRAYDPNRTMRARICCAAQESMTFWRWLRPTG